MQRYEEAFASYNQALQIEPDDPYTWNNLGNVLCELQLFEEAIASYDKALQVEPNLPEVIENRKQALSQWGS